MLSATSLSIIYGLASALVWGTGDFSGGIAAKNTNVYRVVQIAHLIGLVMMVLLALIFREQTPTAVDLLFGAASGFAGMVGVLTFYQALSENEMGVTAPVAALVTAVIPIVFGVVTEGLPPRLTLVGFGFALVSVWLLAGSGDLRAIRWTQLRLPVLAGIGFAMFLILIDRVSIGSVFWPLTAARVTSVAFVTIVLMTRKRGVSMPQTGHWRPIIGAGVFDAGGNALFALAAQAGRLDIASVLSSLYPVATVVLAWVLLGERLTRPQWVGAALAMIALVLITM